MSIDKQQMAFDYWYGLHVTTLADVETLRLLSARATVSACAMLHGRANAGNPDDTISFKEAADLRKLAQKLTDASFKMKEAALEYEYVEEFLKQRTLAAAHALGVELPANET